jgi:hypothetical protein
MATTKRSAKDGLLHLSGSGLNDFETACGAVWSFDTYEDSVELPTCHGCIDAARVIFEALSKKELSACLKTPNAGINRRP